MADFFDDDADFFNRNVVTNTGSIHNGDEIITNASRGGVAIGPNSDDNVVATQGSNAAGGDLIQAGRGSNVLNDVDGEDFVVGSPGAIQADGDVKGANTGVVKDGVVAGGDVEDTVIGDGNLQFNPKGDISDSAFSFGSGDSSVQRIEDNKLGDGSALGGRDADSSSDDDNFVNVEGNRGPVNLANDGSTADQTAADFDLDINRSFNEDNDRFTQDNDVTQIRDVDNDIVKTIDIDD